MSCDSLALLANIFLAGQVKRKKSDSGEQESSTSVEGKLVDLAGDLHVHNIIVESNSILLLELPDYAFTYIPHRTSEEE